uniref:Putative secreted protein n=1 Tax=Anopheles darlingi TaxID=43151 RepID=A0A2M4DQX9_ANODA
MALVATIDGIPGDTVGNCWRDGMEVTSGGGRRPLQGPRLSSGSSSASSSSALCVLVGLLVRVKASSDCGGHRWPIFGHSSHRHCCFSRT